MRAQEFKKPKEKTRNKKDLVDYFKSSLFTHISLTEFKTKTFFSPFPQRAISLSSCIFVKENSYPNSFKKNLPYVHFKTSPYISPSFSSHPPTSNNKESQSFDIQLYKKVFFHDKYARSHWFADDESASQSQPPLLFDSLESNLFSCSSKGGIVKLTKEIVRQQAFKKKKRKRQKNSVKALQKFESFKSLFKTIRLVGCNPYQLRVLEKHFEVDNKPPRIVSSFKDSNFILQVDGEDDILSVSKIFESPKKDFSIDGILSPRQSSTSTSTTTNTSSSSSTVVDVVDLLDDDDDDDVVFLSSEKTSNRPLAPRHLSSRTPMSPFPTSAFSSRLYPLSRPCIPSLSHNPIFSSSYSSRKIARVHPLPLPSSPSNSSSFSPHLSSYSSQRELFSSSSSITEGSLRKEPLVSRSIKRRMTSIGSQTSSSSNFFGSRLKISFSPTRENSLQIVERSLQRGNDESLLTFESQEPFYIWKNDDDNAKEGKRETLQVFSQDSNQRENFLSSKVIWKRVFEAVQKTRIQDFISPFVSSPNSTTNPERQMLSIVHRALASLVEKLFPKEKMSTVLFSSNEKTSSNGVNTKWFKRFEETHGSARTNLHSVQVQRVKRRDMFSWLASPHRQSLSLSHVSSHKSRFLKRQIQLQVEFPLNIHNHNRFQSNEENSHGVYASVIHGKGLFSKRDYSRSEMVIEYTGEEIRASLTDKREKYYGIRGLGCYMFKIDESTVIDATLKGNAARFINHSCDPNCYSKIVDIYGKKHIIIFALRQILPGEELTYDYKFPLENVKIHCKCGAKKCRKYMN